MKYTQQEKEQLISRYLKGEPIASIHAETGVARSTLYVWIHGDRELKTTTGKHITIQDYNGLAQHVKKLESMIEILQSVPCSTTAPLKERLSIIEQLSSQYSVHVLCTALKVSRGTYYNHIFRNLRENSTYAENRKNLREAIQKTYEENRQIFGANKINALLQERGYITSPKMIAELMRELGISSVSPTAKREYAKWKKGENRNVVQQNFRADKPNRIWVSDVTVFKYKDQYYNICVIIDLFSRKVVAHRVSRNNSTLLVTKAFRQACTLRQPEPGLIFHSDRGAPYVSFAFQKLLHEHQTIQSLSRSGRPHDNAVSESFFSYLKKEELYRRHFKSESELLKGIKEYIAFYNGIRPHATLQYKTPDKVEEIHANL